MTIKQLFKAILVFFQDMGVTLSPSIAVFSFSYLYQPWQKFLNKYFLIIVISILVISMILSIIKRFYLCFRNNIVIKLKNPSTEIEIKYGNLFTEKSSIVIGCNEFFDTSLGEVISPNSIQGQFENLYYKNNIETLNTDINNALARKRIYANFDESKIIGKKKKFPIGSTISINKNGQNIFLCAYSTMSERAEASSNIKNFTFSLCELWDEIRASNQCKPVSVAVLGSGLARMLAKNSELLYLILSHFITSSREKIITKKITIVLNKTEKQNYNLSEMESFLKSIIKDQ